MNTSKEKEHDYAKIRKEVCQSYYNFDKMFIQFIAALNKCDTKRDVESFSKLAEGFEKQDAPEELVEYLNASIKNKMYGLAKKDAIDIGKLKAISNFIR